MRLPVVRLQVAHDDAVHVERRGGQDSPSERIEHARRVVPDEGGALHARAQPRRAEHVSVRLFRFELHVACNEKSNAVINHSSSAKLFGVQ